MNYHNEENSHNGHPSAAAGKSTAESGEGCQKSGDGGAAAVQCCNAHASNKSQTLAHR